MVSSSERIKLARLFDQQEANVQRQKQALTRMKLMLLEASAALMEIADVGDLDQPQMAERAQVALDRMKVVRSSGTTDDGEELREATKKEQT